MQIKFVKVQNQILKKVPIQFLNPVNDLHCHHFLEYYRPSPVEVRNQANQGSADTRIVPTPTESDDLRAVQSI